MKKIIAVLVLFLNLMNIQAQQKAPYWEDIQAFKKIDRENPPAENAILFLGSSSFTKWTDVGDYFPDKAIINRGFGGSTLKDLNFYADDFLKPYHPKQIVIYCGENDIASNPEIRPKTVLKRFKNFYTEIRRNFPLIPVAYVSMKLSPSREALWPKMIDTNKLIENYLSKKPNVAYIDITKDMNGADGRPRTDLFLEDMLHMKPEGYRIWTREMYPYLK